MKLIMVAAVGQGGEIGKSGELIWHVPGDLARVKEMTMGHPVIMGRKTYESLPAQARPLPGRTNIVLSRHEVADEDAHDDVYWAESIHDALAIAKQSEGGQECYVFGGAQVYRELLPYANVLELTMIESRDSSADTFFPRWERSDYLEVSRESEETPEFTYHFVRFEKKNS